MTRPLIIGIGGTTRPDSTSEKALVHALATCRDAGCDTQLLASSSLPVEPYDPTRLQRSAEAKALVDALSLCDGVIFASPAYHGGVSGLVKNAIDYTEDLRESTRPYLEGRAVGCIVAAEGPQAMGATLAALRAIVHSLRGWPTPYGAALNSRDAPFGKPGRDPDPAALQACATVGAEVAQFAHMMRAWRNAGTPG